MVMFKQETWSINHEQLYQHCLSVSASFSRYVQRNELGPFLGKPHRVSPSPSPLIPGPRFHFSFLCFDSPSPSPLPSSADPRRPPCPTNNHEPLSLDIDYDSCRLSSATTSNSSLHSRERQSAFNPILLCYLKAPLFGLSRSRPATPDVQLRSSQTQPMRIASSCRSSPPPSLTTATSAPHPCLALPT